MILDIDFDFFVKETVFHDFVYQESRLFMEMLWDVRFMAAYSNPCGEPVDLTKEFILDNEAMSEVLDFIKKCSCTESWAISDSHMFGYKYVEDYARFSAFDGIVHIDRHSDFDILEDDVNAGNWLRYLKESTSREIPIYWIPQSKKDLYVDKKSVRKAMKIKNKTFLKSLDPLKITHIYLCRSAAWVPPWLDTAYFEFQEKLEKLFGAPICYKPIPNDREWNYENVIKRSLEERRVIMELWSQKKESTNDARE